MATMPSTQKRPRTHRAAAAAMPDWSSLHHDVVRLVGDCFLAADDLDYYMDFRAVCRDWRSATDDPKADYCAVPGQFQPSKWALLERHQDLIVKNDRVTLVNVETGRFLVKNIPLLRKYFFVGATSGGLILLGESAYPYPYQARVLNPFTGSIARFKAPIPVGEAREVAVTTSPMMVFISSLVEGTIMWADQNSEYFQKFVAHFPNDPVCMMPFAGNNVYLCNREGSILSTVVVDVAVEEGAQARRSAQTISMATTIPGLGPASVEGGRSYYLVESGGELLLVTRPRYGIPEQLAVHRVDTMRNVLEPVKSIGNCALFVSHIRCLSVDADKFKTVEGGCIYFVDQILTGGGYFGCSSMTSVRVADGVQELMSLGLGSVGGCFRPFTLAQVLADYCKFIQYPPELGQIIYGEEDFWANSESDEGSSSESDDE